MPIESDVNLAAVVLPIVVGTKRAICKEMVSVLYDTLNSDFSRVQL